MPIINFTSNFSPEDNIRIWINNVECSDLSAINVDSKELNIKVIRKGFLDNKVSIRDIFAFIKNIGLLDNSENSLPYTITYEFNALICADNAILKLTMDKEKFCVDVENGEIVSQTEERSVTKKTVGSILLVCFIRLVLVIAAVLFFVNFYPANYMDNTIITIVCGVLIAAFAIVSVLEIVQWIHLTVKAVRSNKNKD